MKIHWDDRLIIDHGVIDDDHRVAISIVNDFIEMRAGEITRERALEIINTLRRHMVHHFEREEAFQRSINWPDSAEHERGHALLARRIDLIAEKLEYAPSDELPGLVHATTNVLKDWLINHILKQDLKLKKDIDRTSVDQASDDLDGEKDIYLI